MTRSLSLFILSLILAACAQAPSPADPAIANAQPRPEADDTMNHVLGGYHWRLQDATDAQSHRIDALLIRPELPVQFDFVDGRIRIANACNGISGDVRIDGDTLRFGSLVSTKMACTDAAVMALDSEVAARLQGKVRFALLESDPPQLVWTAANGDTLRFIGAPTPETRYGNPGETVFLEVAAKSKPCQHPTIPSPQRCLEVRERQYDAQGLAIGTPGEWRLFHDPIEGYTHEEGIRSVLRVKRFPIANPPTDAPAVAYVMEMSIESEMVGP
jgi:heat shock protein HslJ